MSYVESNLISGEKVLYKTGLHWSVLIWPIIFGAFFALPGLAFVVGAIASLGDKSGAASGEAAVGLIFLVSTAILIGYGFIKRASVEMAVTNKRVLVKAGVLRRRTLEVLLSKIESIGVDEGILGRMLGYGNVIVRGTGGTPEPFKRIAHPMEFRRQVQQQIELSQQPRTQGDAVTA